MVRIHVCGGPLRNSCAGTVVRGLLINLQSLDRAHCRPCPQAISRRAMAPEEGFEPPTRRLTAACSTTELLRNIGIRPREFSTHPRQGQRARGPLRPRYRNEERGLAISLMRTRCWSTSALLRASRFHGRTDDRAAKRSHHRRVTGRGARGADGSISFVNTGQKEVEFSQRLSI